MTKNRQEQLTELLNEVLSTKEIKNLQYRRAELERLNDEVEQEIKGTTGIERYLIQKMDDEILEAHQKATKELLRSI